MEEGQLIGITSKLNQISSLLIPNSESDDNVMFIGIHGMGDIGKTTIAMVLYEQIRDEFEARCFLSNIRDTFETHNLPYLQSKLLTRMFSIKNNDICDAQEGIALITKGISQKKSLVVLDDVDQLEQITGLIPVMKKCCFGYGSRVIITTRNADLMSIFEEKRMFKMGELEYKEALKLLSLNAFMEKCPKECYLEHSKSIVKVVGGHPLALKVLGTCLRNKDLSVWNCVIQELQEGGNIIDDQQIFKCLKHLGKLKYIKLNHSKRLLKTPDFTQVPYLERLEMEGCTSLVNIHPSIFIAKRLIFLSLKDCINLTKLPSHITIEVLEVLNLSGCLKLKKLPEFIGNTSRLLQLHLDNTSISCLPSSITTLTRLTMLNLKNCKRLFHIPTTIKWLVSLSHFGRPSELENRKRKLDNVGCLEELDASETRRRRRDGNNNDKDEGGCNIIRRVLFWLCRTLGSNNFGISLVFRLHSITELHLKDCNLTYIPEEIECLVSLRELNLSGNNFSQLPVSIARLYNLKRLNINRCKMLEYYPPLPPGIRKLLLVNCISLTIIGNLAKVEGSYFMNLLNCYKLANNKELHKLITSWMQNTFCQDGAFNIIIPGNEIPDWFTTTKMGSSISIEWDPDAPNANSIRFALCVVCSPADAFSISNSLLITANVVVKNPNNQNLGKRIHMVNGFYVSEMRNLDHVWLFVIPRSESLTSIIKHCREIEFELRLIQSRGHSKITLKKCGVRLITMEEEKGAMRLHTFVRTNKRQLLNL